MCMQCMTTVVVSATAATGIRAWLNAKRPGWLTAVRMRRLTVALLGLAVLAATVQISP